MRKIIAEYPLEEIVPLIRAEKNGYRVYSQVKLNGYSVNLHSVRIRLFGRDPLVCVSCGMKATHFAVEWCDKNYKKLKLRPHINLYGKNEYGDDVLFTKDHIIPKSKGGSDHTDNMQIMCKKCNEKKGNELPNIGLG
jgi:5-methylcytosine-specific restriction endonuclease McrA